MYLEARLRVGWTVPIYSFFKDKVSIHYERGRKYHFFHCAHAHCKSKAKGVRRYLDTGDRASTSNLRSHAIHCFGLDAVRAADKGKGRSDAPDGSIHAAFAK